MKLSDVIKNFRKANGMSMDELADSSGLSKGYISMLENDVNPRQKKPIQPTLVTLKKLATGMNIELDQLIEQLDTDTLIKVNGIDDALPAEVSMFGQVFKQLRRDKDIAQEQMADLLGLSRSTIGMYEQGKREPNLVTLQKIADYFGVSVDYMLGRKNPALSNADVNLLTKYRLLDDYGKDLVNSIIDTYLRKDMRLYPYYHHIAAAGTGFYFDDIPADTIEAPEMPGADFVIGVSGDSMEPTFSDGDDLYVKKTQAVQFGEVGIFLVEGTCLVKELGASGLVSHNENYETIKGTPEIRCIGRVLGRIEK